MDGQFWPWSMVIELVFVLKISILVAVGVPEAVCAAVPRVGLPPPGDHARLPDHVPRPRRRQVRHEELHRLGALRRHALRRGESNLDKLQNVSILLQDMGESVLKTERARGKGENCQKER